MLKYILPLIPSHILYCEPFFGGGAVFFAKEPSEIEVINDINGEAINFYRVLKLHYPELKKEIETTLHSRELYRRAKVIYENPELFDKVKRAWAFWTVTNQGFSNQISTWGYDRDNSCTLSNKRKIEQFNRELNERLKGVGIECNDALKVIKSRDREDGQSFFYCDPPYFNSDCGHYKGYNEMDFKNLLDVLSGIKGKFLLSCYDSEIIQQYIRKNKWSVKKIEKVISVTYKTSRKKIEMLVRNYE